MEQKNKNSCNKTSKAFQTIKHNVQKFMFLSFFSGFSWAISINKTIFTLKMILSHTINNAYTLSNIFWLDQTYFIPTHLAAAWRCFVLSIRPLWTETSTRLIWCSLSLHHRNLQSPPLCSSGFALYPWNKQSTLYWHQSASERKLLINFKYVSKQWTTLLQHSNVRPCPISFP